MICFIFENLFFNKMYSCYGKAEFVSHDPLEIILKSWFSAQETFIIINNIFLWNLWCIFSKILRWTKSSTEMYLFEINIFCDIINVFVTFD